MFSSSHLRENTLAENYKNRTIPAFISLLKYTEILCRDAVYICPIIFLRALFEASALEAWRPIAARTGYA